MVKSVLFHRSYRRFQGGHLKVRDYFDHVQSMSEFSPAIYIDPLSISSHLWTDVQIVRAYDPEAADILFIAGMDWGALTPYPGIELRKPVINLIQHLRHSSPTHPLYQYLARPAIRICVSEAVRDAIHATGRCNGPLYVIRNGVDFSKLTRHGDRTVDVFVAALKSPALGADLAGRLRGRGIMVDLLTTPVDRVEFIARMANASIAVTLPNKTEGFFLPALEAMFLGCALVCPDARGNRGFCIDGETCLMPPSTAIAMERAVIELLSNRPLQQEITNNARRISLGYDLLRERAEFQPILAELG